MSTGEVLKAFLKDFGSHDHSRDPADLTLRRERELFVYRDLFAGAALGTAEYYGSVWEETEGRFWLLLEFVSATPLRHLRSEERLPAAAWLARLQGHFARNRCRFPGCDRILHRHDTEFFWSNVDQAISTLSGPFPSLASRVENVLRRYGEVVEVMARQPVTLVHGDYKPVQVLYDAACRRICPIDWELAALGSPLYDLSILTDGYDPPRSDQFLEAYREEALRQGLEVPELEEMRRITACFRLHRVKNSLSRCVHKQYSEKSVRKVVDACEKLRMLIY